MGRDIAAIDCVTYALLQRHEPTLLAGLTVIDQTPYARLPLITASGTAPETLHAIRDALTTLVSAPECRGVCDALFIGGFSVVAREARSVLTGITANGSLSSAG